MYVVRERGEAYSSTYSTYYKERLRVRERCTSPRTSQELLVSYHARVLSQPARPTSQKLLAGAGLPALPYYGIISYPPRFVLLLTPVGGKTPLNFGFLREPLLYGPVSVLTSTLLRPFAATSTKTVSSTTTTEFYIRRHFFFCHTSINLCSKRRYV